MLSAWPTASKAWPAIILAGLLLFFVLEKLVLWRHCHQEQCEAHDPPQVAHDQGRSGTMIMIIEPGVVPGQVEDVPGRVSTALASWSLAVVFLSAVRRTPAAS